MAFPADFHNKQIILGCPNCIISPEVVPFPFTALFADAAIIGLCLFPCFLFFPFPFPGLEITIVATAVGRM